MADIKQKAGTSQTLEASGAAVSSNAAGHADDANLDNTATLAFTCSFVLTTAFNSTVTVNEDIELYLVPMLDGTNEADKDTTTPVFQPSHYAGTFITPTTGTGSRRMTIEGVAIGPYKYVARLWNKSGQTMTAGWTLVAYPELVQN